MTNTINTTYVTNKKYKLKNPFKPDEFIQQEVYVSDAPQLDYKHADWVAIDTEYLTLDYAYDNLCVIQIASPHPDDDEKQQIEIIWIYDSPIESKKLTAELISNLLENPDLDVIMHVATADLPRIERFVDETLERTTQEDKTRLKGKLFDTKVGAKIVLTNTNKHGLDSLVQSLIDPHFNKDKNQTSSQWDLPPSSWNDQMIQYAALDVYYLAAIKNRLQQIAKRRNKSEILKEIMTSLPSVTELYKYGLSESILGY